MEPTRGSSSSSVPPSERSTGLALGLLQLAAGPAGFAALAVVGILILRQPPWTASVRDAVYAAIVIGMIAAHALVRARSADPAARKIDGRHAMLVSTAASVLYVVAQSFRV